MQQPFSIQVQGYTTFAEEGSPTGDLSVFLLSKYVWRGYELSKDSIVIQPSMSVGYKGFGFNLWGNLDTDQDTTLYDVDGANFNETDMTLSYDGSAGMVGYSIGYIYYGLDGAADTQEIYAGVSVDTIAAPSLTIYRDYDRLYVWPKVQLDRYGRSRSMNLARLSSPRSRAPASYSTCAFLASTSARSKSRWRSLKVLCQ